MHRQSRVRIVTIAIVMGVLLLSTLSANSLGATEVSLETPKYGEYGARYVHLDWSHTKDALFVNYEVHMKVDGGDWEMKMRIENADRTDHNVTELKPGTAYWFKIRDNDRLGGQDSDELFLITASLTPVLLNTPADEDITPSSIALRWSVNNDPYFREYHIVLREFDGNTPLDTVGERYEAEYVVTGLSENETYCFFIRVENDLGEVSDPSNTECPHTEIHVEQPQSSKPWEMASYGLVAIVILAFAVIIYLFSRRRDNWGR